MATDDSTAPARFCVLRGALNNQVGNRVTGIFTWTGKSWRTAKIGELVKELPPTLSDRELTAEFNAFVKSAADRVL